MFERFLGSFRLLPAGQSPSVAWRDEVLLGAAGYSELAAVLAGCSVENGLYRLHSADSGPPAAALAAEAFPEFAARATPFGYDWLGRQFALDTGRVDGGEPLVLMLEPGTGEALEIPAGFAAFHNEVMVDLRDAALASTFFASWASSDAGALPLSANECVGYRVPLFLGGSDTLENLEVVDLAVYWSLSGQLRLGAAGD